MPQLLEHIDAIARKKGRDVLLVDFGPRVNFFQGTQLEGRSKPY